MSGKNIQMKHFIDGEGWESLYPVTMTENVFNEDGKNVEQTIEEELKKVDDLIAGNEDNINNLIDEKLGSVVEDFADVTEDVSIMKDGIVNVKFFGAKGDGVTSDSLAIKQAIEHIRSGATGGTVYFPSGVYLLTEPIQLKTNVSIVGAGRFATIFKKNGDFNAINGGSYTSPDFPSNFRVDYFSLKDFSIDGADFDGDGVNLQHCHYYVLQDLYIINNISGNGIYLEYAWVGRLNGIKCRTNLNNYYMTEQINGVNGYSLYSSTAGKYGWYFEGGYNINMTDLCHDTGAENVIRIGDYVRALKISGLYIETSQGDQLKDHMIYCLSSGRSRAMEISNVNIILKNFDDSNKTRPFWIRGGVEGVNLNNIYIQLKGTAGVGGGLITIGNTTDATAPITDAKIENITISDSTSVTSSRIVQVEKTVRNIIINNLTSNRYNANDVISFRDHIIQRSINIYGKVVQGMQTNLKPVHQGSKGEIIWSNVITSGSPIGWVCASSSSPTWLPFGVIE